MFSLLLKMTSLDTAGKQNLNLITIIENHDLNPITKIDKQDSDSITKIDKQDSDPIINKQSNNPTADEQNPIAVPNEQNPIAVPDEQNPIAVPDEQNPIAVSDEQNPIPVPDEQNPIAVPDEQNPIAVSDEQNPIPVPDEQNPIAVPDEQNPIAVSDEQNPIPVPDEQNPIAVPDEQNPIAVSDEQNPIPVPDEQNPIAIPDEQNPIAVPDEQNPIAVPDEQNPIAVPDEQNPIAVPDEQNPIAVPDEQNLNSITITSQEPNPITDVQQKVNSSWEEYRDNWNEEVLVTVNKPIIQFSDAYRNRMREKGLHPLNIKHTRFMERLERMEEHCKAFPPASTVRYNVGVGYDNVLFNDEFELLECMVPKVSSTTWLELYIKMLGEDIHFEVYLPESHKIWKEISLVNKLGQKDTAKRYQTYTKFMITRNPFERLLSAYKSKFTVEGWYLEVIGPGIIRSNHLAGIPDHEIARVKGELNRGGNSTSSLSDNQIAQIKRLSSGSRNFGITFLEFLNYVMTHNAASGREALDHHWAPATSICKPCAIRYDILAKFETLSKDSEAILDYVHATNSDGPIHFPLQKPKVNSNECKREFEKIPTELVRSLYQLYKDDFIIFGYEYDETENSFC